MNEFDLPIPVNTPLTVISADEVKEIRTGLVLHERDGGAVFLLTKEDGVIEVPLQNESDLYEGLEIAAPTLFGYVQALVVKKNDKLYWESDTSYGALEFSTDDRRCWTTSSSIRKGIKKVHLTTDEGKLKLPVVK